MKAYLIRTQLWKFSTGPGNYNNLKLMNVRDKIYDFFGYIERCLEWEIDRDG